MRALIRILLNHSVRDLFKYKSFFLLIFVLIIADRLLRYLTAPYRAGVQVPEIRTLSLEAARFVFVDLPGWAWPWLFDIRLLLLMVGLFFFKQLISMWPSSDMRRMHRLERGGFGLLSSLIAIQGRQVVWDAAAVGSIVLVVGAWTVVSYLIGLLIWQAVPSALPLLVFGGLAALSAPIAMAGFSFSSKLAVLSKGRFGEKLSLFFKLFTDKRVFIAAWLFFLARIVIELLFVVIVPVAIILTLDIFWLRILLAGLIATPLYSFLKMASFKFFLQLFRPFPLVRAEYQDYYTEIDATIER
jgi:hypothetical protein